jgi:hypothetical protein
MVKALAVAALMAVLSGCVAYPVEYSVGVESPTVVVGYYDPSFGYWTGYGWDRNYYGYGHGGYGRGYYHGPRYAPRGHGYYHHR